MKLIKMTLLLGTLLGSYAMAQATDSTPADNTKSNKTDLSNTSATADRQSNQQTDLKITRRIRQQLMADKSLSTYAHNVKIITADGAVTLNGVVRSQNEKAAVEMKAMGVAGKEHVTSELKIASGS